MTSRWKSPGPLIMKSRRRNRYSRNTAVNLGFQIAPMIDVVFVILLFFMVKAGDIQIEKAHVSKLPGGPGPVVNTPDEIAITIAEDGQVALNDDPLDSPEATDLKELAQNLKVLKESADSTQSQVLVTVLADEMAQYQRVVDVMDALSRAKIGNVTFAANSAE
jgi:biopolymer transport protein ExbD